MNITGTILHSLIKTTVMTQLYVIWNEVVYNYMQVCLAEIFYWHPLLQNTICYFMYNFLQDNEIFTYSDRM